jgi:hypothetical protein
MPAAKILWFIIGWTSKSSHPAQGSSMSYHFPLNMMPLALGALISGALALYTWRNRRAIGATPFSS